jgi:hypothetical protein
MPIFSPQSIVATGAECRRLLDERGLDGPIVDLAASPVVVPPVSLPRRIREIGARGDEARDTGYASAGFIPLLIAERAYHLRIAYQGNTPEDFRDQQHDLSEMLCVGFFGPWLEYVVCQPQHPMAGRWRDQWHYRVFMKPDWKTPLGRRPIPGHMTWEERRARLAASKRHHA